MNPNEFLLPDGKVVYCDRPDKLHAEKAMLGFYKSFSKYLNREMTAIDIGTSCGDSTVVMGHFLSSFPGSRVIAFEPSREIYPLLIHNIRKSYGIEYHVHPLAAGDAASMTDFVYGSDNGGLVLPDLIPERGPNPPTYQVRVVNVYDFLYGFYSANELKRIGFVKIDTEGYDFVVLRGLAPLIRQNKMPIMLEWWDKEQNSEWMFKEIDKLSYVAFNSFEEPVTHADFHSPKRTQDIFIFPNEHTTK